LKLNGAQPFVLHQSIRKFLEIFDYALFFKAGHDLQKKGFHILGNEEFENAVFFIESTIEGHMLIAADGGRQKPAMFSGNMRLIIGTILHTRFFLLNRT
jgi:hypothetical protein